MTYSAHAEAHSRGRQEHVHGPPRRKIEIPVGLPRDADQVMRQFQMCVEVAQLGVERFYRVVLQPVRGLHDGGGGSVQRHSQRVEIVLQPKMLSKVCRRLRQSSRRISRGGRHALARLVGRVHNSPPGVLNGSGKLLETSADCEFGGFEGFAPEGPRVGQPRHPVPAPVAGHARG